MGLCLKCQGIDLRKVRKDRQTYIGPAAAHRICATVKVLLDGIDVSNETSTVGMRIGPEGWVLLYEKNDQGVRHVCDRTMNKNPFIPGRQCVGKADECVAMKVVCGNVQVVPKS